MALEAIIFLLFSLFFVALASLNGFLIWKFYNENKKLDAVLENGKAKDLKDFVLKQQDKNRALELELEKAFLKIENLEDISAKTIHKTGIIRFNPFNDMGGNQSFAIALLNAKNNGFVISSLFIQEGNRVYTKEVKNGKSSHSLSKEELEAIEKAIKSK